MPTASTQTTMPFTEMTHNGIILRSLPLWPGYWAGDDGHVWSTTSGTPRQLRPIQNRKLAYPTVTLYHPGRVYLRKLRSGNWRWCKRPTPKYLHHLIASVWLGPKPGPRYEIDHANENKSDARPSNLRWLTRRQNYQAWRANHPDYYRLPEHVLRGEDNPTSKLTEQEVRRILPLRGKLTGPMVADIFGVSDATIYRIWGGRGWRHVQGVVGGAVPGGPAAA